MEDLFNCVDDAPIFCIKIAFGWGEMSFLENKYSFFLVGTVKNGKLFLRRIIFRSPLIKKNNLYFEKKGN